MIKKLFGVTVCFAAFITQAGAQAFGIELTGGLQGMHYTLKNGQSKLLPGGSLSLNYTFSLSSRWGLLTGVTGGIYRSQATLPDEAVFTSDQVDDAVRAAARFISPNTFEAEILPSSAPTFWPFASTTIMAGSSLPPSVE